MCYDHMAGVLGVTVADGLIDKGYIVADDTDFTATPTGEAFFADLGIDLAALRDTRRHFARRCLDWSERRPHVGGALGAGLADVFLQKRLDCPANRLAQGHRDRDRRTRTDGSLWLELGASHRCLGKYALKF